MAQGSALIVSGEPRGVFWEGYVTGTPSPGTVMEIDWSESAVGGRFYWEAYGTTAASSPKGVSADGNQRPVAVLLEDWGQGKLVTDAYVTGSRCFLYFPAHGERLNMLVSAAGTGTGDAVAVGDVLTVNDGDGLLILSDTGSPEMEPFILLEASTDVTATGTLLQCLYTGH